MLDRMNQTQSEQQQECYCDLSGSCENCPYTVLDDVETAAFELELKDDLLTNLNEMMRRKWSGVVQIIVKDGSVRVQEYSPIQAEEVDHLELLATQDCFDLEEYWRTH